MQELQKNYDALKRLHDSMVSAVEKMELEMEKLRVETAFYKAQLINADKNVGIQKQIVIDQIRQDQQNTDSLVAEIMELRKRLKQRREGGNLD